MVKITSKQIQLIINLQEWKQLCKGANTGNIFRYRQN